MISTGSGEPSPDIEMQDEARTLKQKLSTTADEEGEQDRQTAIETYQQMKNFHLLS